MAIFLIPKSKFMADDAKTGSFASTKITSPSRSLSHIFDFLF